MKDYNAFYDTKLKQHDGDEEKAMNLTVADIACDLLQSCNRNPRLRQIFMNYKRMGHSNDDAKQEVKGYAFITLRRAVEKSMYWAKGDYNVMYDFIKWAVCDRSSFPMPADFGLKKADGHNNLRAYQNSGFLAVNKRKSPDKAPQILILWREWQEYKASLKPKPKVDRKKRAENISQIEQWKREAMINE